MVKLETPVEAAQLTRDLLAWRLYLAYLAADEAGYRFSRKELAALRNVSAWPAERLKKAAEWYEQFG